jgi:hypothetical protein
VEQDPPAKGIFDKIVAEAYPEEINDLMGWARSANGSGYTFTYNVNHPAYEAVDENEEDLTDYLVTIMAQEIPRIDLLNEHQKLFEPEDLDAPERIAQRTSRIVGQILREYYTVA